MEQAIAVTDTKNQNNNEKTAKPARKKKAVLIDFQLYKNGVVFKKVKADSYEDAKFKGRTLCSKDDYAYFEIKTPTGGIVPLF